MKYGKCNFQRIDGTRCNNVATVIVPLANRGNRNACFCTECANRMLGYSDENSTRKGKVKANGFTFSMELETAGRTNGNTYGASLKGRMELAEKGFVPTSDCTVDIEFKSPIWEGLNAPIKFMPSIESLMESGDLSINESCGTHFHVGHRQYINSETIGYIRRFIHSIFVPLSDCMVAHPTETANLFGRGFEHWAQPITEGTYHSEHCNFANLQHPYTIEWRICKYQNAKQYQNAMRCCKDLTNCIIENFIKHFNDTDYDTTRYSTVAKYRKHKAEITAQKMVRIYKKYAGIEN